MRLIDVRIRVTPITNRVVLARFGRDKTVALETVDIMSDFLQAIVQYAFDGKIPDDDDEAIVEFGGGSEQFRLTVARKLADRGSE